MPRRKSLALAIAIAASCSPPASPPAKNAGRVVSDPASVSQPVQVSMSGEANAMPSVAALGDRVALVWTGTRDGVMNVYSAVSEDRGATFNIRRRVNDQPGDVAAGVEQPPRVAISSSSITVVWSSKRNGSSAIRMARSTDAGRSFGPAVTIHDPSLTGARGWESLAAAADGSVRVAWLDGRNAQAGRAKPGGSAMPEHMDHSLMDHSHSPRQDVYEAVIDERGKIIETPVATTVCFCCKTAVAIAPDGRVSVAWRHIFPGSIRDIAMAVSADGRTFSPLARVSEDKWEIAGCPEDGAALAVDATGTTHIVWPTVVNERQPQKVVFYSSTKDGRAFTPRLRLSSADQDEAAHPQIAIGSSGTIAAVWDEPRGNARGIILRIAEPDGRWGAARMLSAPGSSSHPVAASVADGFVVGWTSGEGATSAITLQRIGVSPVVAKSAEHNKFTFHGTVESIDRPAKALTVSGENVEGWMGAMTMVYRVDNAEMIDKVKVGDRITATVYDGDFQILHGAAVVP